MVLVADHKSTILTRLGAHERWLPAVAGLLWWVTFHPGFISEDSLVTLTDARSGEISVWFTAWWVYLVDLLTLGTRAISLLTLVSVLGLEYATYFWIASVLPKTNARAVTVLIVGLSPLVGAMGNQIRHDVALTSGLLICAGVLTRAHANGFDRRDYGWLALAMPLVATRHNGVPTLVLAAVLMLIARRSWQHVTALFAVAAGAGLISVAATSASGNERVADPVQTVEWLVGDLSCVLSRGDVAPTEEEWSTLTRIAAREDWPQPRACRVMNPLFMKRLSNNAAIAANYGELIGVWRSLLLRYPRQLLAAHASRVRLFLPPVPPFEVPTFIHSTIVPNDYGLAWTLPAIAERARLAVRAWNALGFVLANAMLWLIMLGIVVWRVADLRVHLAPTIVIAIALTIGLIVAAPISEGRYGLFTLICAQSTVLYLGVARLSAMPAFETPLETKR